jgi:3D (Asp-Asp-Asp) domain-containing protein/sulfur carrier protein ThiS
VIRRNRLRPSLVLAAAVVALGFGAGSLAISPVAALASSPATHVVTLQIDGSTRVVTTAAPTVASLLAQRGIEPRPDDYIYPAPEVPLSDELTVVYRSAVPVTILFARRARHVVSSAQTVADLLDEQQISLGADDVVTPGLDAALPRGGIVRVVHVVRWERRVEHRIAYATLYRLDLSDRAGHAHVVSRGRDGVRVAVTRFTRRDGGPIQRRVTSYLERAPQPRVIDDGLGRYGAYGDFSRAAVARFGFVASSKVRMVATAYTPHCYGCSGITATGRPAGPGIVAVDPRVIPLGSRLYIPGYGFALAGDTGGAIRGDRVDLGFASYADAIRFGRREVTVYTLK